ncbi:RES family NAD+ phosphorylase [Dietzia timorensis]|uniref:RES family NAD+ phosphorylase n=1 Tax=Dietzia timorensis TaxID=499555 RepID=UPI0009EE9933|nr:RES family NAD+ phosphorylase [Dietzia timorensis]
MIRPGQTLYRVHSARPDRGPLVLNPTAPALAPKGGRFDCLSGLPHYTYMSESYVGAIAETFCRDLELDGPPAVLNARRFESYRISVLTVTEHIPVAALFGANLTAIGANKRLVAGPPADYDITRQWSAAVLKGTPAASGLKYSSRIASLPFNYMLTGKTKLHTMQVTETHELLVGHGREWLEAVLDRFSATIED